MYIYIYIYIHIIHTHVCIYIYIYIYIILATTQNCFAPLRFCLGLLRKRPSRLVLRFVTCTTLPILLDFLAVYSVQFTVAFCDVKAPVLHGATRYAHDFLHHARIQTSHRTSMLTQRYESAYCLRVHVRVLLSFQQPTFQKVSTPQ